MKRNFTNLLFCVALSLLMFNVSCRKDLGVATVEQQAPSSVSLMTPKEINDAIKQAIDQTGKFDWANATDRMVWSAAMHGNNILTIGYGNVAYSEIKSNSTDQIRKNLVEKTTQLEQKTNIEVTASDIVNYQSDVFNFVDVKVTSYETVVELRKQNNIRYIEPTGYRFFANESKLKSESGCDPTGDVIQAADQRLIAPNCYVSWVHDYHKIPQAWSYSTGKGVTVGLIDTGVSDGQPLLGSSFNDGYSTGRFIQKYGTFVDSWWSWSTETDGYHDKCSHGTSMAATIASPRNNDYMPVGVAYNANLVSYRATGDVVLDGYHEQNGVANALYGLANRTDVKVISMSIGYIYSIGKIADAVKYAYSKGKLIIAAGGTSTSFTNWYSVIFPASMDEVVAATGITDGATYQECAVCHKGSQIDFTIVMQRQSDDTRTSVTTGYSQGVKSYVGGSSVATATTAGIAALIWGRYPNWTREQVLQRMKESSHFYPNRHSEFGYGSIDALKAVL